MDLPGMSWLSKPHSAIQDQDWLSENFEGLISAERQQIPAIWLIGRSAGAVLNMQINYTVFCGGLIYVVMLIDGMAGHGLSDPVQLMRVQIDHSNS